MANTSSRTLRLLSLLQNHRYWPGSELAERLEVSVRTLRRDVDRLRELGYPVEAQRGVDGGYQLAAGAVLPPLVLDDDEAVALAVGLQIAVQSGTVAGIAESSVRALTKVVQVMPQRLRRRVDALRAMTVPVGWVGDGPGVDPARSPRSPRPAATPRGSSSSTPTRAPRSPNVRSNRTAWCRWDDAGIWSHSTSPAGIGAASASIASTRPMGPGTGSAPGGCRPRTPPRSYGPASTTYPPRIGSRC